MTYGRPIRLLVRSREVGMRFVCVHAIVFACLHAWTCRPHVLHEHFINPRLDAKTIIRRFKPLFDKRWNDAATRYLIISGKEGLKRLKSFYKSKTNRNLTQKTLIAGLVKADRGQLRSFVEQLYHLRVAEEQCLHY